MYLCEEELWGKEMLLDLRLLEKLFDLLFGLVLLLLRLEYGLNSSYHREDTMGVPFAKDALPPAQEGSALRYNVHKTEYLIRSFLAIATVSLKGAVL